MPVQPVQVKQIFLMQQRKYDIRYNLQIWHRTDQDGTILFINDGKKLIVKKE